MADHEQSIDDKALINKFIDETASREYPVFSQRSAQVPDEQQSEEEARHDQEEDQDPPPYRALEEVLERAQTAVAPDFDVKKCSWEDVHRQLKEAEDEKQKYFAQAKGPKGILRKLWRKLGKASTIWGPALDAIPDEMGLSVLKGGLALIFNLAKHSAENSSKILEAFEDIPDVLLMAEEKRETFPSNDRLQEALENLYQRLFDTIPKYLELLLKANRKSPFQGEEISNLQNEVKRAGDRVRAVAESCAGGYIVETHTMAKEIQEKVQVTEDSVLRVTSRMETVGDNIDRDVQEMKRFFKELRESTRAEAINSRDWLAKFLLEQLRVIRLNLPVEVSIHPSRSSSPQPASIETLRRLVRFLRVPPLQATEDLQYVLRKRHAFDLASQTQVQTLWKSEQFQHWFFSGRSGILLVDANFDTTIVGRLSPMSLFCGMMSVQLPDTDHNIWLQFFCGQYTRSSNELYGVHGMVRSFIVQLLLQLHGKNMLSLAFLDPDASYEDGGRPRLDSLCRMLGELVRTLPHGMTVFCVMDGISYFETEEMAEELCYVVGQLRDIAADVYLRPHFKLFMSSASRSKYVQNQVEDWQHVTLKRGSGIKPLSERAFWNKTNEAMRRWS